MARKRLTEYTAKTILSPELALERQSLSVDSSSKNISSLNDDTSYVVKVDQGVKKRMKKGLVKVHVSKKEVGEFIEAVSKKGYQHFLVEEFVSYDANEEKYLSLERTREGIVVLFSNKGGIDVEEHQSEIKKNIITSVDDKHELDKVSQQLQLPDDFLSSLLAVFETNFFSFLEINPLVIKNDTVHILDLAVEVDSTAEFFVNKSWSSEDFTDHFSQKTTEEEKTISKLAKESQAAFSLEVLNIDGSIFVLLSGGGASLVIADEVYNLGYGKQLANYGEYSGNPNAEETYIYTKAILNLLFKSKAPKKVLIIGGGVANFTDIRITFKGVVKALTESFDDLKKQNVHIFVRRGGPHQDEGLEMMRQFLKTSKIPGEVCGPEIMLTKIVNEGIQYI